MNELELLDEYGYREEVLAQLFAVRESGAVNMHSRRGVRDVADQCGFAELVSFCDDLDGVGVNERGVVYGRYLKEMGRRYCGGGRS